MQQLNFPIFYTKFGVRTLQHLLEPRVFQAQLLQVPLESTIHYLDYNGVTMGPLASDPILKQFKTQIPVKTVRELTRSVGKPAFVATNVNEALRQYFQQNRHMRDLKDQALPLTDRRTPIVINYAPLVKSYRYQQTQTAAYQKVRNLLASAVKVAAELAEESPRNQFFFFNSPRLLPGIAQLEAAIRAPTASTLKYFTDPETILVLELWKLMAKPRTYSVDDSEQDTIFKLLPVDKFHLVNFVFQESGQWMVLNLGVLNSYRQDIKGEVPRTAENRNIPVIDSKIKLAAQDIAKRTLRFFMAVTALRSLATIGKETELEHSEAADTLDDVDPDLDQKDVSELAPPDLGDVDTVAGAEYLATIDAAAQNNIEDLEPAALQALLAAQDEQIEQDLSAIEQILTKADEQRVSQKTSIDEVVFAPTKTEPHSKIIAACDKLAEDGVMTVPEARRMATLAQRYQVIEMPNGQTLEQFVKIDPEKLLISPEETKLVTKNYAIPDERMLRSSLSVFDSKYINEVMARDTASMVLATQNFGVAVTGLAVNRTEDILGAYDEYAVRLTPIRGRPSTVRFRLPVVREDGVFVSNGVPYRIRKQRTDLPIRKVSSDKVALISYYGKAFITRGKHASSDYGRWMERKITAMVLSRDPYLSDVVASNVCDYRFEAPRQYSVVSKLLKSATIMGVHYCFDHQAILDDEHVRLNLRGRPRNKDILVGYRRDSQEFYYVRQNGTMYYTSPEGDKDCGTLESLFGLDISTAPIEYTSLRVFSKEIPIGVVLGAEMGLQNLIDLLDANPRYVLPGTKLDLQPDEFALAFNDKTLVLSRKHRLASLILGGFSEFSRNLKQFSIYSFDSRGVYQNLLESADLSAKYLRELDLMFSMFVDPITKEILEKMNEPTTFKGLLFRATQMLLNETHPELMDPKFMRIRGYERIPGAVYAEMVSSLRAHNNRQGKQASEIEQKPFAVWTRITEDPAKTQVQEINPIKAIKEAEAATYAGEGGRMKRAMTRITRSYHPNDMGVISESTVDNSDVGININMSANPKLGDLRGMQGDFSMEDDGPTSLLSTSAMLAPCSNHDDPKRVNFIAIQQEHAVACSGYHQFTVRTGYDAVIAERTTELFAVIAKKPGIVRSIKSEGIIVDYDDGTSAGYQLGRRFGNAAGLTIAHKVITNQSVGSRFEPGDAICYNSGFFEPDFFDPKKIVLKNAVEANTALLESSDTHEDSSAISLKLSSKLSTEIAKVKTVQVAFDQKVSKLVQVGQVVEADTVLCYIEDAITANAGLFTSDNIETLKAIGAQTPKAKVKGVVERIEYFYHGDKEDMGESVLELANIGDKELKARALAKGEQVFTGKVDGGFRIDANQLPMDTMAIRIYITSVVPSGVGDKGVFANQLKTVHGRVFEKPIYTTGGTEIDGIFGMKSIEARIVNSPIQIGTVARLMFELGKKAARVYRGQE